MRKVPLLLMLTLLVGVLLSGCVAGAENVASGAAARAASVAGAAATGTVNMAGAAASGAAGAASAAASGAANLAGAAASGAASAASGAANLASAAASGTAETANSVACAGLHGMEEALGSVGILSPDTSVADLIAFKRKVDSYVNPLRVLAITMGLDPLSQFIIAYDTVGLFVNSLPPDASLGAASNAMRVGMAGLIISTEKAQEALECAR